MGRPQELQLTWIFRESKKHLRCYEHFLSSNQVTGSVSWCGDRGEERPTHSHTVLDSQVSELYTPLSYNLHSSLHCIYLSVDSSYSLEPIKVVFV